MHALVTGAAGFLGLYIVEQLLARGAEVCALCRRPSPALNALGVPTWEGDIRNRESTMAACRGADVVFHTAAVAGIWGTWQHYYETNVRGTEHVIAGCLKWSVPKLVFTSSPSVTFDGRAQENVDESTPYPARWLAYYPQTKALAEQQVLASNSAKLATCALRPHLVWGPRDGHLIPRLIARAKAGQLRRVGDGSNLVDMVYVENAARAHLQAADALAASSPAGSPVAGRAYFISQGEPVNCWEWINDILSLAGLPPIERSISLGAAWRIGAALETIWKLTGRRSEPRMTRFLAAQLGTSHYFDIGRARADFGYAPEVATAEGMRRLGEWIQCQQA